MLDRESNRRLYIPHRTRVHTYHRHPTLPTRPSDTRIQETRVDCPVLKLVRLIIGILY